MRKEAIIFLAVLVCSLIFVQISSAQNEADNAKILEAFQCLNGRINETSSLTLEEAIFSGMAGFKQNKISQTINSSKESNENCWPAGNCNVKETAQVAILKQLRGENNQAILSWLGNQTGTPDDLIWYLQITIDNNQEAQCSIGYDGTQKQITVEEDLTLSGNGGNCLTIDNNDYWLRISPACVEKTFSISCNWDGEGNNFVSSLVYREEEDGVTFVSSTTKSNNKGGIHEQKINAKCFTKGNSCDYEGSLWAASAFHYSNINYQEFLPYLLGLAETNGRYFPEAFIAPLLGGNNANQLDEINEKVSGGHWDIPQGYSKYMDTGLVMIAFGGADDARITNYGTLDYLFSEQTENGCWNNDNIQDTAFLLYASGWQNPFTGIGGGSPGPGGNPPTIGNNSNNSSNNSSGGGNYQPNLPEDCSLQGGFCTSTNECATAGGQVYPTSEYVCTHFSQVCCSVRPQVDDTCADLGGEICEFGKVCSSSTVPASDGPCCSNGICQLTNTVDPVDPVDPTPTNSDGDSNLWLWVTLFVVLIGLVVLGIIYRNKIRVWLFQRKGKVNSSKFSPPSGGSPGILNERRPPPRFGQPVGMQRAAPRQPIRAPQSSRTANVKDKEVEETLRKLKEMSK